MNIIKGAFLVFFMIYAGISISLLWSLDPHRRITQYAHRLWTTEDGLPQNTVISIIQTSDGYMWFGTQEGLARFDGVIFTTFKKDTHPGIKSEYIYTLYEDSDKLLWIGTSRGLNRMAKVNGEFEKIPHFSSRQINTIYEDSSQNMWFGTDKGLARLKDNDFQFFTTHNGLASNLVRNLREDNNGNLWIATYGGGLSRFSPADGKFSTISKADGLADDNLVGLCIDRDNNVWVGTEGKGMDRITLPEVQVTCLNSKNGLSNDYPGVIYEDKEGSLWIGTEKGLNQLHNGKLMTWTTVEGLSNNYISCVYEDSQKRLWVGTYSGGLNILASATETGTYQVSTLTHMKGYPLPLLIASLCETLAGKLVEDKRLSIPDSLHIMKQICSAFTLIHKKKIIHRDLKPDNIMLIEREGNPLFVKLLDFGLARAQTFSRLTESGTVLGTVSYLSPEQITENAHSFASDIYSLGVTSYEMLTGKRPFSGENTIEIMMQILNKIPDEPISLRGEIPLELNNLIIQMMSKNRKGRPDIKEVYNTLEKSG